MDSEFMSLLDALTQEKGINKDVLLETIKHALLTAYKKKVGKEENVEITIDEHTGAYKVYLIKNVVPDDTEVLGDDDIVLKDAYKYSSSAEVGGTIRIDVTPKDFGRMAVLNAKQVIEQKLKEAERDNLYEEFIKKQDELIEGTVQRVELKTDPQTGRVRRSVFVNLEKTDCVMYEKDQVPTEQYRPNQKIYVYCYKVEKTTKGPKIFVSHSHPNLVVRLLEREVPELADGSIVIKNIVREAGYRTKIAVFSRLENVDAVGTCIGARGIRINPVMRELKNEKIDLIEWNKDPKAYVTSALLPAKVRDVFLDDNSNRAIAVVPDNELSVAIGKEGINVRLASKLTGLRIDIRTVSEVEKQMKEEKEKLVNVQEPVDVPINLDDDDLELDFDLDIDTTDDILTGVDGSDIVVDTDETT